MTNLSKTGFEPTLFTNPRSPFARRIRIALDRLQIDFKNQDLGNVFDPQPELWKLNPLGMIPTLALSSDFALSGSLNILEYLHEKTNAIWPHDQTLRTQVRQVSTWCEGIMQSSILYFQEVNLHEQPSPRWIAEHIQSIEDTIVCLSQLNESVWIEGERLTQAGWDLVVALEYVDFRLKQISWRQFAGFSPIFDQAKKHEFFTRSSPKNQ